MSGNAPVDPAEVPVFTGDLVELDRQIKAISSGGTAVSTKAGDVHSSFGGLQAFYQAPEAEQLFATTKPVSDLGRKLSTDMGTITGALGAYARDVAPLKKKLEDLKREAETFRSKVADDEKWREDGDLIEENLDRRNEIAEVWAQFQAVERAAHAKIVALVGGKPLRVNDGSNAADMYGYDGEALKQAKSLPWGDAVEESVPAWQVWEHAWDFGKGVVVDGVWGTLKGLGGLVGLQGWDTFKQSWTGLAKLATGLAITAIPGVGPLFLAAPSDKLPSWLRDSRTAMKETGKALLAWDQWGSNPSRAAGAVTFNVLTTVFTGGAGGAAAGAGKAGAVAKALSFAGKAGRAVDPMTYIFKGAGAGFSKIGDVMAGLKGMGNIEIPKINIDGAVALPDGAKMLPDGTIHLPSGTAVPEGAIKLPNDTIRLPEGTATLPPGTVKLPVDGPSQFMDPKGNLYDSAGNITQRAEDAPVGKPGTDANTPSGTADAAGSPSGRPDADGSGSPGTAGAGASPSGRPDADGSGSPGTAGAAASPSGRPDADGNTPSGRPDSGANAPKADAPKADSPATVKAEERVLVGAGVGGRADDGIRLGSDMSDPLRTVGDHTPGPRPDTTPGGRADDLGRGPSASHEPPTGGGHTGGPGHTDGPGGVGHTDGAGRMEGPGGTGHGDAPSAGTGHGDAPSAGGGHGDTTPGGGHGDSGGSGSGDGPGGAGDDPFLPGGSEPRPDGARYIEEPTAEHVAAARFYDGVRANPESLDIRAISENTGISQHVLDRVRTHFFLTQHVVTEGPGLSRRGYFTPRSDIAEIWEAAGQRALTPAEAQKFERYIGHEFTESNFLEAGLPYIRDGEHLWEYYSNADESGYYHNWPETARDAGAHELALNENRGGFVQWPRLGLDLPDIELAPGLANIEEVTAALLEELRSKGIVE
ncbi:hypothetical protein HYE82_14020 [Streptomyces sp. BR123]|uniref:hypothetical protein n=1 Tax=Streptomyces sp. BR123 TaxID=2749828 RepID=UPI0015C42C37|nr:hypothetical protein [Streptomyces sp. BR123]NXY95485.1 hypothetical protein [Streptomyces sp. BR123]